MSVLSPREAAVFTCLAETVLAPAPPLPPVTATDAARAFDAMLAAAPPANRVGLRAALLILDAAPRATRARRPWHRLPPGERLRLLLRLQRAPLPAVRQLVEGVRSAAALAYYGDPGVQRILGYEPRTPVRPPHGG